MPAKTPFWWYGSQVSLMPVLLEPAALAWRLGTWLRWKMVTPYRSRLPVICVGNLTAGGSGKTPTAIAVAKLLKSSGEDPVFLTRGYGGSVTGAHLVDPKVDTAAAVGDEPLLLAQLAPTIVSADRKDGARLAETLDASVIVMDDGFQNPHLEKDLSIVMIDRAIGIGNGLIMPAGPLRAPLSRQLSHAQALVPIGGGGEAETVIVQARSRDIPVFDALVEPVGDLGWLKNKKVIAFAGIAHPEKFFRSLQDAGATITGQKAFPDHHRFSEKEASRLLAAAVKDKAMLVTTEKDLARLDDTRTAVQTLREKSRALAVTLTFNDEQAVSDLLKTMLKGKRAG